jgi:hypothetical protein
MAKSKRQKIIKARKAILRKLDTSQIEILIFCLILDIGFIVSSINKKKKSIFISGSIAHFPEDEISAVLDDAFIVLEKSGVTLTEKVRTRIEALLKIQFEFKLDSRLKNQSAWSIGISKNVVKKNQLNVLSLENMFNIQQEFAYQTRRKVDQLSV